MIREFPGRVRLVFKDFPLDFHPGARPAALAARCAGLAGRYWEYHDLLFVAQPAFAREDLLRYADRIGIERDRLHRVPGRRPLSRRGGAGRE